MLSDSEPKLLVLRLVCQKFSNNVKTHWHYSARYVATICHCVYKIMRMDHDMGIFNTEEKNVHALRTKWRNIHSDWRLLFDFSSFPSFLWNFKLNSKSWHIATTRKIFTSFSMRTIFHHSEIPNGVLFLHYYCSGWCVYPIFMPLGCCFNALWELNNNSKLQSVFYALESAEKIEDFRSVDSDDIHVENQYETKAYIFAFIVSRSVSKHHFSLFKFNFLFFCLHPFWTLTTSWNCFSRRVALSFANTFEYVWLCKIFTHDNSSRPHFNGNTRPPTNEFHC